MVFCITLVVNLLLIYNGGVFPHIFINPPKKIGTYSISHP